MQSPDPNGLYTPPPRTGAGLTRVAVGRCAVVGLGLAADAYNISVLNLVKNVLVSVYPRTIHTTSLLVSMPLWGGLCGQLACGFAADYVGRRAVLLFSALLSVVAALAAAACVDTATLSLYTQLAVCFFAQGLAAGGELPLAAAVTSESSAPSDPGDTASAVAVTMVAAAGPSSHASHANTRVRLLALVFAMQGVGTLLAGMVGYALFATSLAPTVAWRLAVALGAAPGLIALYFRWRMTETPAFLRAQAAGRGFIHLRHWRRVSCAVRVYARELLGTTTCWFLLSLTFYGNSLFSADITRSFGLGDALAAQALNVLYLALLALPGYVLAVGCLPMLGARYHLQWLGFTVVALLYLALSVAFNALSSRPALFLVLYGATFLFSNFGPNVATFVIPAEFYPAQVRGTCHGLSAAAGKLGAAVATYAFPRAQDALGTPQLLLVCCGAALLGSIWTLVFVPRYSGQTLTAQVEQKLRQYHQLLAEKDAELAGLN